MRIIALALLFSIKLSFSYSQNSKPIDEDKYRCLNSILNLDFFYDDDQFEDLFGKSKLEFMDKIRGDTSLTVISKEELKNILNKLNEYSLILCLRHLLDEEILELKYTQGPDDYNLRIYDLEEKRNIVDDYINLVVGNNYCQYDYQQSSKTWIKSFHIYHDNDVFLFSKLNADRDYTGGFRFEFMTDQFKMRLFKLLGNNDNFLSYQSIFLGGEGYTPYIRFTEEELNDRNILYEVDDETQFLTSESLDSIQNYMRTNQQLSDRPFASFQYIGRGKYRLFHTGVFRIESLVKIGVIGGSIGKGIQAVLHQDLTKGSQRVLNWEDQIGSGGRLAFNIEHKIDLSLFSTHSVLTVDKVIKNKFINHLAGNTNVYLPLEVAFGTVQTHVGTGIGISNKSFREISGINDPKFVKFYKIGFLRQIWLNSYISMEYNYRYVFHNSMLEGVGFFKPFTDDPLDDEALTIYSLNEESIERNLHKLQWHIGFRLNKVIFYYKHVRFINREFNVKGVTPKYEEFTTEKWYGYGRIGLNFLL